MPQLNISSFLKHNFDFNARQKFSELNFYRVAMISNTAGVIISVCGLDSAAATAARISAARCCVKYPRSTRRRRPTSTKDRGQCQTKLVGGTT
jgi:hypothetical protein